MAGALADASEGAGGSLTGVRVLSQYCLCRAGARRVWKGLINTTSPRRGRQPAGELPRAVGWWLLRVAAAPVRPQAAPAGLGPRGRRVHSLVCSYVKIGAPAGQERGPETRGDVWVGRTLSSSDGCPCTNVPMPASRPDLALKPEWPLPEDTGMTSLSAASEGHLLPVVPTWSPGKRYACGF